VKVGTLNGHYIMALLELSITELLTQLEELSSPPFPSQSPFAPLMSAKAVTLTSLLLV